MKRISFIILFLIGMLSISIAQTDLLVDAVKTSTTLENNDVIHLTTEQFKKQIFDYDHYQEWKYLGKKPAIVDFYADWCRPCKMIAPILESLQKEYGGKIQVYKVNTQYEKEIASVFGISGIPALLFIPADGEPTMSTGALPKETFEQYIKEYLKVEK